MSRSQFRDWEAVYEIEREMIEREHRKAERESASRPIRAVIQEE